MDYARELRDMNTLATTVDLHARRQVWANRRGIPSAVEQRAKANYDRLILSDEALRRISRVSPAEAQRVFEGLLGEEQQRAQLGAGANLRMLQPKVAELRERLHAFVEARRRDVSLTFPPDVLTGFDGPAMVQ